LELIRFTIDFFCPITVAAINSKKKLRAYLITAAKLVFCWDFKFNSFDECFRL